MSHLEILVPFGLPPADLAKDLVRELKTPAFATMLARARPSSHETFDDFSHALPHETWIANQFGQGAPSPAISSPPIAVATMQNLNLAPSEGFWFMLQPVHIHVGSDSMVLTDIRQLPLSEQESRALFETIRPLFDEAGKSVMFGDAQTWFVRADEWQDLQTSTPDAACGHNIHMWMPKGNGEREWRRLQNDVHMHWHQHPVNAQREARNLEPVNSVWLWGGATTSMRITPDRDRTAFNLPGWMRGFGQFSANSMHACSIADIIGASAKRGLLIQDAVIEAALAGEWGYWLDQMHKLEADWFAPLLAAIQANKIDQISLILTNTADLSEFSISKNSLRKFWVKPALTRLLP